MKKKNIKGFTLIELLAVIVILGILMLTAIPAITKYIENSRKDAFWQTAKSYIEAARTPLLNGDYMVITQGLNTSLAMGDVCGLPPSGTTTNGSTVYNYIAIPLEQIDLEKGKGTSSFNRAFGTAAQKSGYVVVVNESATATKDEYVYYFAGIDAEKNGIEDFVAEKNLSRNKVKKGTADKAKAIGLVAGVKNATFGTITAKPYAICGYSAS